jgi:hypothetical protein
MRLPRIKIRRWMIAIAFVAVVCWLTVRARRLEERAAFHAQEKQCCLSQAWTADKNYHWMEQNGATWCGSPRLLIEIAEDYEAVPMLRERAAYHDRLEAIYRRSVYFFWIPVPAEKPFGAAD